MNATIHGTIPIGSGMGSSGAFEVAIAFTLKELNSINISKVEMAKICFRAERDFLEIETGIMDQFTSVFGEKDSALFIDCRSLDFEVINFPSNEIKLLVIDSNVKRAAKSALNKRKYECNKAIDILESNNIKIEALRDLDPDIYEKVKGFFPKTIAKRVKHIVYENQRVLLAKKALENGDLNALGRFMNESHVSLSRDYEVSCKELDEIFNIARNLKGVYGVRMTGAGFGGCVIALINKYYEKYLIEKISKQYSLRVGKNASIYPCDISNGALRLN
ncbi:MAG: galactokinase [Candidatus Lokiarchaeota archaeon]|nr:galactokinase [Candidatus Lokiarchaeota archaeon]